MILAIALDERLEQTEDGLVWGAVDFERTLWEPCLSVFDGVRVIARLRSAKSPPRGRQPANFEGVSFSPIPFYVGPEQYLVRRSRVRRAAEGAIGERDAVLVRSISQLAAHVVRPLEQRGRPYAVQVVADPWDVMSAGAIRHPLRPLFRRILSRRLRRQVRRACAVAYVTESALQRRYPPPAGAYVTHYSNIDLPSEAILNRPKAFDGPRDSPALVFVGSLERLYKAPDILLKSIVECKKAGIHPRLTVIGDGRHRAELESVAREEGLAGDVEFIGHLPAGDAVRRRLDQSDLFVLPSRQEGLPRALIEAMARGLPCVSTRVGGVPELLPDEDLVEPGDASALAAKLLEVLGDPQRMSRMSQRNMREARKYSLERIAERRIEFLTEIRSRTAHWRESS